MRTGISLRAAGMATGLFLAITFSLCVAFDLFVPRYAMYHTWLGLVPGFHWLTWESFFLGLIESVVSGRGDGLVAFAVALGSVAAVTDMRSAAEAHHDKEQCPKEQE